MQERELGPQLVRAGAGAGRVSLSLRFVRPALPPPLHCVCACFSASYRSICNKCGTAQVCAAPSPARRTCVPVASADVAPPLTPLPQYPAQQINDTSKSVSGAVGPLGDEVCVAYLGQLDATKVCVPGCLFALSAWLTPAPPSSLRLCPFVRSWRTC